MHDSLLLNRRKFIDASCASALAIGLGNALSSAAASSLPSRMKLSLSAYSFNRFLPRNWYSRGKAPAEAPMSLFDVMDFAAEVGFDAVELTAYYFPKPLTKQILAEIKRYAFRLGLDISGTAIGNNFCLPDGPELEAELELARQWIEFSERLDAPVIRIFAGKQPKGENLSTTIERCAANIRSLLPKAEAAGVVLALENHGGITAEPDDLLRLVDAVGDSKSFGVNFDGGNFAIPDPYAGLEKIAPHAVNAQLKVAIRREPKGEKEPADLKRTIEILRSAGYRGYVALEFEEQSDPKIEVPRLAEEIRTLITHANR